MSDNTEIINGVTVTDITPELSEEEGKKRVNEFVEQLLAFNKNRKKDKTA